MRLKNLTDTRDNRGKRHSLVILIVTFVFATLVNRSKVSSIHRYMVNKIDWLREIRWFDEIKLPTLLAFLSLPKQSQSLRRITMRLLR